MTTTARDMGQLIREAGAKAFAVGAALPTGTNRKARRHYAALLRRSDHTGTSGQRAMARRVSRRRAKKGYR